MRPLNGLVYSVDFGFTTPLRFTENFFQSTYVIFITASKKAATMHEKPVRFLSAHPVYTARYGANFCTAKHQLCYNNNDNKITRNER